MAEREGPGRVGGAERERARLRILRPERRLPQLDRMRNHLRVPPFIVLSFSHANGILRHFRRQAVKYESCCEILSIPSSSVSRRPATVLRRMTENC